MLNRSSFAFPETLSTFCVAMILASGCDDKELVNATPNDADARCSVEEVAGGLAIPYGIVVDDDGYLVTVDGKVVHISSDGEVEDLASTSKDSASGLVRDGDHVIVIDNTAGALVSFDADWKPTILAKGLGNPVSLAADGDGFVVTDFDNNTDKDGFGRLLRVARDGSVEVIADEGLGGPGGVVVDDEGFYVTDFNNGRLLRVTRKGEVSEVAAGLGNPVDMKRRGDYLYMADFAGGSSGGRVLKLDLEGNVEILDVSGVGSASGLALTGDDLVIADISGGRLFRVHSCIDGE